MTEIILTTENLHDLLGQQFILVQVDGETIKIILKD